MKAPEYDQARRRPAGGPAVPALGAVERNPAYRPPAAPVKPWTDRHPALLWAVLLGSIAAIGAAVWRLMRGMPPAAG